ncbi:DUF4917 family protein [Microcoleus sp. S36b_A4]|uniref:DUF4917 family protein n=1 Tax=Microcoleus sp. S36b_A4 TaxID=3055420 RepID=UPI002FD78B51
MNDEKVLSWQDIKNDFSGSVILLGNGFSCAVWGKFQYPSLYEKACVASEHPLSKEDQDLFKALETKNFERVLLALSTARMINKILGKDYSVIKERYESIKSALGYAVRSVHIPWKNATESGVLNNIRRELLNYKCVYSTNYDLLIYWAVMSESDGDGFKDYFFQAKANNYFDITNTEIHGDATRILYLHGGLHLDRSTSGQTIKRKQEENTNLLDSFGKGWSGGTVPLLIAEGDAKDKLKSIYSSDYLSFAYAQFAQHKGALVVFEHSLGDSEQHIVDAIKRAKPSPIAISISRNKSPEEIIHIKAELHKKLDEASKLVFFDAETHPLGLLAMRVNNT